MTRERWAWQWARSNALKWTPRMERCAVQSLARIKTGGLSVGADQAAGSISALSSLRKALARETRDRKLLAATAGNWTKVKKLLRG